MNCIKCKKTGGRVLLPHMPGGLCQACAASLIERRIRKEIRVKNLLPKGASVSLVDDGTQAAHLSIHLVSQLAKPLQLTVTQSLPAGAGKETNRQATSRLQGADVLLFPTDLTADTDAFMAAVATGHGMPPRKSSILGCATDQEVELLSTFRGISGITAQPEHPSIHKFLDNIERRHPETRFALRKSIEILSIK